MNTLQLSKLTGVSQRQLQWWDEKNVVSPVIEGHSRNYSIDQATVVGLVVELRRSGINLEMARKVARRFEKHPQAQWVLIMRNHIFFSVGAQEIAECAAAADDSVVVAKIKRFSESEIPPAPERKHRVTRRPFRAITAKAQARTSGKLDAWERSLTLSALQVRAGVERPDYTTVKDFRTALSRDRSLGG
jgi:DNA-binding transcriptional MerR regulator